MKKESVGFQNCIAFNAILLENKGITNDNDIIRVEQNHQIPYINHGEPWTNHVKATVIKDFLMLLYRAKQNTSTLSIATIIIDLHPLNNTKGY